MSELNWEGCVPSPTRYAARWPFGLWIFRPVANATGKNITPAGLLDEKPNEPRYKNEKTIIHIPNVNSRAESGIITPTHPTRRLAVSSNTQNWDERMTQKEFDSRQSRSMSAGLSTNAKPRPST